MNLSFVQDTLRPYLSRLEGEIKKKLLTTAQGKSTGLEIQFDTAERLRGDPESQLAGLTAGRTGGFLTGNDCRRALNLNEAGEELDVYLCPVNYTNAIRLLCTSQPNETELKNV